MTDTITFRAAAPEFGDRAANRSFLKAALDQTTAVLLLILLSPLLLATAIAIRLDSAGPIFFRQARHGRNGEIFMIFKFRTMTEAASRERFRQVTGRNDARVTRIGRFLRSSSIDELPQLINVVRGEMSLVGPRPHPIALDTQYRDLIPHYMERYSVRPGITGLAQVRGHRGATPTVEVMATRVAHDLDYVANWSFWLDALILIRTPLIALRIRGA